MAGDEEVGMAGYLGEFPTDLSETNCANHGPTEWAMAYIERYGQIDGDHHKAWVLDQVARILHGTPVLVTVAKWANGHQELRMNLEEPSPSYVAWADSMRMDEFGPGVSYDEGIAP